MSSPILSSDETDARAIGTPSAQVVKSGFCYTVKHTGGVIHTQRKYKHENCNFNSILIIF